MMPVAGQLPLEQPPVPLSRGFFPKKAPAHIVVHAGDLQALLVQIAGGFGADKPAGSRDQRNSHEDCIFPLLNTPLNANITANGSLLTLPIAS
jgi:hypothetical protein